MPVDIDEDPRGQASPEMRIAGSIAVEIDWLMHAAGNPQLRGDHPTYRRIYAEGSELEARVRSLWSGDPIASAGSSGAEAAILAHHGGILLSSDPDLLLGRLDALCAAAPVHLALASETEATRRTILRRLELLRSSGKVRRRCTPTTSPVWQRW